MMEDVKALLLAGGIGSRLQPLTHTLPKCLVPVAGKPMLDYWYDALEKAQIQNVLINTHHLADQVRAHIDTANRARALTIAEAYEPTLLGSAGTIHANKDWAQDASAIVIIYADNLSDIDLETLVDFHLAHDDPMTMMMFHALNPSQCGIATLDEDAKVVSFVEKPKNPTSDLANAGLYVVDIAAWNEIADQNAFDIGFDILPLFTGRMRGFVHAGYHRDIGTHEALAAAAADMAQTS